MDFEQSTVVLFVCGDVERDMTKFFVGGWGF